jgi:hypothetical protein
LAGLTSKQVADELATATGIPTCGPSELADRLLERGGPLTIVLDALDEASAPEPLVHELIAPLVVEGGAVGIRLLTATRRALVRLLPGARVLDLDTPNYLEPADLTAYAHQRLTADRTPPSPYARVPELAGQVAAAVAERAGRSFLIAQLTAQALAADQSVVDTHQAGWQQALPATVAAAMGRYLASTGEDQRRVADLLRPLAWAEGDGLADDELWAALATALGTRRYHDHDVRWLRATTVGNLLHAAQTSDGVAYRLFHAALAEHLRADRTNRGRRSPSSPSLV